ncbi:xanthine dehydrogenase family protein molybdopterin-binding subunit [Thermodesulfobacteriota bacterium]
MTGYRIVHQSLPKKEVGEKVTGKSKYSGDILFPDLLFGRILRSPCSHARILSIDTSRAASLPGVKAIITNKDTPNIRTGRSVMDRHVFASDKVRFLCEPVAAVAAVDEEIAEEALDLIKVEYDELPAVFDPLKTMEPGAPLIHEDLKSYQCKAAKFNPQGNVLEKSTLTRGDVEKVWEHCHLIYEDSYRTPVVYQGFTQPHETTTAVDASGRVTIWASNKAPFNLRQMVSRVLNLPMSRIRVAPTMVGGDFGGKGTAQTEPICVLLTLKSGRPVRLTLSREEELTSTFLREATITHLKIGVSKDGDLIALEGNTVYDTGAYCDLVVPFPPSTWYGLHGPYRIPNVALTAYRVYTNNSPRGHMRSPTTPQGAFALESHLDMVARKLGVDPVEFRLRNAVEEGDIMPTGQRMMNPGVKETLRRTQEYIRRNRDDAKPNQGWGVASYDYGGVPIAPSGILKLRSMPLTSAWIKLNEDGTAVLFTGIVEQGCGPVTVMAQIVAEILDIRYEDVSVVSADTDGTPFEDGVGASLTTYRVGLNVKLAAEDVRNQLFELAAESLKVKPSELKISGGRVHLQGDTGQGMSIGELATAAAFTRGSPILGTGSELRRHKLVGVPGGEEWRDAPQHGTHAVQVEVDPETGHVRLLRYFVCQDVGFALNPQNVEGQIEGAVGFGVGYALLEEVIIKEGRTLNPNLTDYRLPTSCDLVDIDTEIVEIPSITGAFGLKGLGEAVNIAGGPAIANAVYDAVGMRITQLPITPEKVFQAIQLKSEGDA